MTTFNFEIITDQPDRIHVRVDNRFEIAITRITDGLHVDVSAIFKGQTWTYPCDRLTICEEDIPQQKSQWKDAP